MKKFRAGIIGLGRIGSLLEDDPLRMHPCTHAGALFSFKRSIEVIGACDISSKRRDLFVEQWNFCGNMFKDWRDMLEDLKLDILVVASSTHTHFPIVMYALKKRIPGIILEKPIASNLREARLLLEKYKGVKDTFIVVAHDRRFFKRFIYTRRLFNKGLGPIVRIKGELFSRLDFRNGKNPILHDGTHVMDIVRFFAKGNPIDFDFKSYFKGKYISGNILFDNNIVFEFSIDSRRKYYDCRITVEGKRGMTIIGNSDFFLYEKRNNTIFLKRKEMRHFPDNNPYIMRIRVLLDALKNKIKSPKSTLEDGYWALYMCEKIWDLIKSDIS